MPKLFESGSSRAGDPINFSLTLAQRDLICLRCPLTECVGIESRECSIRIKQRQIWREKDAKRKAQKDESNGHHLFNSPR